jgi:hypothetical protein
MYVTKRLCVLLGLAGGKLLYYYNSLPSHFQQLEVMDRHYSHDSISRVTTRPYGVNLHARATHFFVLFSLLLRHNFATDARDAASQVRERLDHGKTTPNGKDGR